MEPDAMILADADDDVMTINEFMDYVKSTVLTDYDGSGYFAIGHKYSYDFQVNCSDLFMKLLSGDTWDHPEWATHVVWFSK